VCLAELFDELLAQSRPVLSCERSLLRVGRIEIPVELAVVDVEDDDVVSEVDERLIEIRVPKSR